jgi:hypothetical protein
MQGCHRIGAVREERPFVSMICVETQNDKAMLELSESQIAVLERLRERGFALVAFPLYASHVGVRRGDCAALLAPVAGNGLRVFGDVFYLVQGNPAVRVRRGERDVFVWKKSEIPVTPERDAELAAFAEALSDALLASV